MTKTVLHKNNQIIGRLLRTHRILQGYNQAQAGALLGISFQQFQKYENGTNRISAASLLALSWAWDIPVSDFFPNGETPEHGFDPDIPKPDLVLLRDFARLDGRTKANLNRLVANLACGPSAK